MDFSEQEIDSAMVFQAKFLNDRLNSIDEDAETADPINAGLVILGHVLYVLEFNRTLWKAVKASYKGTELAGRCLSIAQKFQVNITRGDKTAARVKEMVQKCHHLQMAFHTDHHSYMWPAA